MIEDTLRMSIFYTYVKINGQVCKLIIDSGSCINAVCDVMVQRLGLVTTSHPSTFDYQVSLRVNTYDNHVLCDVLSMKIKSIILESSWLYNNNVHLYGRANAYSFVHRGRMVIWYPYTIKPLTRQITDTPTFLALMSGVPTATTPSSNPPKLEDIMMEYGDIFLEELPNKLPPIHHIQHTIDLVPRATFPNMPHYHMEPSRYKELYRQVQELLEKGCQARALFLHF
ncbi:unnamed protein product [Spirodela intermedia]|uniref:Uncharacterized protein n=1 Tax=Spirodela intermedia TaxID=51605 RepID=A0A7I8KHK5_SPIIN|nr:unnamed protein product [Spirodela intermedia]